MKGIYAKGKPASGSFERVKNNDDYDYNADVTEVPPPPPPTLEKTVDVAPQTVALLEPVENEGDSSKKNKNQKTITEKIFWKDSKQIAQETVYEMRSYDFKLITQKNFDQSGKLIQILDESSLKEYGNGIANGAEYEYYLQNNFATGIQSISKYIQGEKFGKQISYFPEGNISYETNYRNGLKDGEELVFFENGSLKSKRTYKEEEPFDGNFDENMGDISINSNYINGLKEGESVAVDEEKKTVSKGIYKNGKPFSGTFVIKTDGDFMELISVENFKKTGLQKIFSYRLDNLEKTYTIQNEKLNGMTTFYDDGKVVGTLEYKNDEPYNGTLIDEEKTSVYKNGKIIEENFFED